MPTFQYHTLGDRSGSSVIDAPDRAAALRELRRKGITPTRVEPLSSADARRQNKELLQQAKTMKVESPRAGGSATRVRGLGSRMSRSAMSTFILELATAVQAGLPLMQGLRTIERQVREPHQKAVINRLLEQVEHGKSLSDAQAGIGRPFSELVISLTRAGEASGKLGEILQQTAQLLDRDLKLRRSLVGGLLYPAMLGVLIVIAIGVMVGYIVPKILAPFADKLPSSALPVPTRIVMFAGDIVIHYWPYMIGAGVVLGLVIHQTLRSPAGRLAFDRFILKVPLLGKTIRDVAVARFTRTLGTLTTSGLPALQALRITKATLGNKAMEQVIDQVCDQVSSGKTISEPMERSGYFPSLLTQIIGLGERSGRLPQMLNQAANVFEDRTEASLKAFTSVFPVLMILVAAMVIGFVMAGVLLPLIQMQDLIGR